MSSVAAEFQITRGGNAPHSWGATDSVQRFAVVLHDINADRRGEADTLTISVDFEDHVMDGFAALSRYIVERSPHRRLQPNAGPMIADPDAAPRRRSLAVASLPCFHAPENTAPNRKRSRTNEEPRCRQRGFSLTAAGLPHWSDMDGTGTDRLHSLFCPLQMISPSLVGMLESGFGEGRWPRNIVPARLCRNQVSTESPTLRRTPERNLKSG